MKVKLFCSALLLTAISYAGIVPKNTAMFYEANYYKYLNKEISLNVSSMSPSISRDKKLKKGYRFFQVGTYDKKYFGGRMNVLVPSKMVESLILRFGLIDERDEGEVSTKSFRAVLKYDEDNGLYAMPKEASKSRPFPSEGEKSFTSDIVSLASSLSPKAKASVMKYAKKLAGADANVGGKE